MTVDGADPRRDAGLLDTIGKGLPPLNHNLKILEKKG
jgi:hypothetical protein